jgi:hypothetical protein
MAFEKNWFNAIKIKGEPIFIERFVKDNNF